MIYIGFIGNCQMLSLCFYLQQCLKNEFTCEVRWILYSDRSDKCENKITEYDKGIDYISNCDIIIYQSLKKETSELFNEDKIMSYKKDSCILISLPHIFCDYKEYDKSILRLQEKENKYNVTISVSDIINNNKHIKIVYSNVHPTTFLFLEILKKLCVILKINFFIDEQYNYYVSNKNFMNLPSC